MKALKTTKLGAALALVLAIAAPIAAAVPADAATFRVNTVEVMHGQREVLPVRYSHRGEITYRDMHWRLERHRGFERDALIHVRVGR